MSLSIRGLWFRYRKGFTLVELMLIIGILAILASIILLAANPTMRFREAKLRSGDKQARELQSAINQYIIENLEPPVGISDEPQVICSDGFSPTASGCVISLEDFLANKVDSEFRYLTRIPQHPWFEEPNSGFRVFMDAGRYFVKPIQVEYDIALVLDQSTSMKFTVDSTETGMSVNDRRFCRIPSPSSRWIALDRAVRVFTSVLSSNRAHEQVSIISFASDLDQVQAGLCGRRPSTQEEQGLTDSLGVIDAKMTELSNSIWNGNTEMAGGVDLAVNQLLGPTARKQAEKFIILFTDGNETAGDIVASARNAASRGITVYIVTLGVEPNIPHMNRAAEAGNGEHTNARTEAQLRQAFRRFAEKTEDY